ncbi:MAG: hypothetical protein AAFO69_04970 [Bacteroidota bacterium]
MKRFSLFGHFALLISLLFIVVNHQAVGQGLEDHLYDAGNQYNSRSVSPLPDDGALLENSKKDRHSLQKDPEEESIQLLQTRPGESIHQLHQRLLKSNQYFKALSELKAYATDDSSEDWMKMQFAFNFASFMGESDIYREYVAAWEQRSNYQESEELLVRESAHQGLEAVKTYVLEKVEGQQVVMFNESHFYPSHRRLVRELLPALKEAGFTHLAMEALYPGSAKALNKGKSIEFSTGYYTREQEFQRLIRQARALGLELVAYDEGTINREQLQAKNIYDRTLGQDQNARVIVYGGYAHIDEIPSAKGKEWMAAIFKRDYNIDPITFSQTALFQYRSKVDEICVLNSSELGRENMAVDHVIVNNLSTKETSGEFSVTNTSDKTVQLALFDKAIFNRKKPFGSVPLRSALLAAGETYFVSLDLKAMHVMMLDENGELAKPKIANTLPLKTER